MTFKPFSFLALATVLLLATGCGHQQKIQELLDAGSEAQDNENYPEAIRDYSEVLKLDSKSVEAHLQRGTAFVITGEFDRGISDLSRAIRLDPTNATAYEMRGYAYFGKDEQAKALSDYNTVLGMEPDNVRVLKMRGKAFYWRRDYTNALIDLTKALQFETNDAEIYDDRGQCFYQQKQVARATADFDAALRIDPEDATALYAHSFILYKGGRYAEAAGGFATVIRLKPKQVTTYNELAWLLATCPDDTVRNGTKAITLATKACNLSKWKRYADIDTLAAAYAETGDFDSALKYQKQAAEMDGIPAKNRAGVLQRLDLYSHHKPYRESGQPAD